MGDSGYHGLISINRKQVTNKQIKESERYFKRLEQKKLIITFEGTKEEMEMAKKSYLFGCKVVRKQGPGT